MAVLNIAINASDNASAVVGNLSKDFDALATKAGASLGAMGEKFKSVGSAATLGLTLPLAGVGLAAVSMASDLAESTSKAGVLFGSQTDAIVAWSKTAATSMGLTQQGALDGASTFAIMGKAMGLTEKDTSNFSQEMVGLAADLGSFNNVPTDEAIGAIGAALRGEAEPMRKFGVMIDDATIKNKALELGLISSVKDAITPQQKALAISKVILDQTTAAQGDFARTSDGLANQQKILTAKLKDTGAELGEKLLPIALKVVEMISGMIDKFSGLSSGTQGWIVKIGLLLAAIGPVLSILGTLMTAISFVTGLIAGVGGISAVVGGLGAALTVLTGPIALVVGAVALLATAWVKDWGGVRTKTTEFLGGMWSGMKDFASNVGSWVKDVAGKIANFVKGIDWGAIGNGIIGGITKILFAGPQKVFEAMKSMFGGAFDRIKSFLGIHSPSTMAAKELGLPIAAGIGAGIKSGLPQVMRSVTTNNYFSLSMVGGASAGQDVMGSVQLLSALYG